MVFNEGGNEMQGEFDTTTKLIHALNVMVKDIKIRAFLEATDPKALEQALEAIDEAMNGPKQCDCSQGDHPGSHATYCPRYI